MEKKGLSYIDWSISFGIFLISVIMLFILAKPYLTQDYSNEYLLSIAKQGLEEYAYVEVSVFPLFIGSDQSAAPFQINNAVLPSYSDLFEEDERIAIVDGNFDEILGYNLVDPTPYKKIEFEGDSIQEGINIFYVLYSSEDLGYPSESFTPSPANGLRSCFSQEVFCTFGIEEKRKGFFMDKFDELELMGLEDDPYTEFKKILKYPETKNLIITIVGTNDLNYDFPFVEPTESDDVYVLRWSDYNLTKYGQKDLINITIKVW